MFARGRARLAARRGADGRRQHVPGLGPGRLRRVPGRRSRRRTSATASRRAAGRSATSAAACCSRSTSWSSTSTRAGPDRARPCGSACSRPGSGGRLHGHPVRRAAQPPGPRRSLAGRPAGRRPLAREAFGQLASTLRELRGYPQTLAFLVAYLFFNDGIQTVIGASSVYGTSSSASPGPADHHDPASSSSSRSAARCTSGGWPAGTAPGARSWPAWSLWTLVVIARASSCRRRTVRPVPGAGGRDRHRPRRQPGALERRCTASSSRAAARPSTSACTRPASGARAGSAPCCSAWSTSSPAPTAGRSSRWVVFFVRRRGAADPGRRPRAGIARGRATSVPAVV